MENKKAEKWRRNRADQARRQGRKFNSASLMWSWGFSPPLQKTASATLQSSGWCIRGIFKFCTLSQPGLLYCTGASRKLFFMIFPAPNRVDLNLAIFERLLAQDSPKTALHRPQASPPLQVSSPALFTLIIPP
jgi:hypothetical protein